MTRWQEMTTLNMCVRLSARLRLQSLSEQDKVLQQLHEQLAPTHMGEPLIQKIRSAQIEAGENAVIANLRGMGLL
jgi:hypothetical protein